MSSQEEFNQTALNNWDIVKRLNDRIKWVRIMLAVEKDKEKRIAFEWLLQHFISIKNNEMTEEFDKVLEAAK